MIEAKSMTVKDLRNYGLTMGAVVAGLFGVLLPLLFQKNHPYWPFGVAMLFWLLGLVIPSSLRIVYSVWMRFGLVMGRINSTLILSLVYWVLFVPIALFFRLTKRDRLHRDAFRNLIKSQSYRVLRQDKMSSMEKPY